MVNRIFTLVEMRTRGSRVKRFARLSADGARGRNQICECARGRGMFIEGATDTFRAHGCPVCIHAVAFSLSRRNVTRRSFTASQRLLTAAWTRRLRNVVGARLRKVLPACARESAWFSVNKPAHLSLACKPSRGDPENSGENSALLTLSNVRRSLDALRTRLRIVVYSSC